MKHFMCPQTRVGHTKLLTTIFPTVLFLTACDFCGPPTRIVEHWGSGSMQGACDLLKLTDDDGRLEGVIQRSDEVLARWC